MTGLLERTLGILEHLAANAGGLPLASIADGLGIPRSAAHRIVTELVAAGYVRQLRDHGDYVLTTKLASIGLNFLSNTGVLDIAQPLLDRLAEVSGEFVRLGVVDNDQLTWVAKAQGARKGLRYDPDMGAEARLSCTSSGLAWLATLADEQAIALVAKQGIGTRAEFGPNAPETVPALLEYLRQTRKRGFSVTVETFTAGMTAMAAAVQRKGQPAVGVISIAGPVVRLTEARMLELGPLLLEASGELAAVSDTSLLFNRETRADAVHPVLALK